MWWRGVESRHAAVTESWLKGDQGANSYGLKLHREMQNRSNLARVATGRHHKTSSSLRAGIDAANGPAMGRTQETPLAPQGYQSDRARRGPVVLATNLIHERSVKG